MLPDRTRNTQKSQNFTEKITDLILWSSAHSVFSVYHFILNREAIGIKEEASNRLRLEASSFEFNQILFLNEARYRNSGSIRHAENIHSFRETAYIDQEFLTRLLFGQYSFPGDIKYFYR